MPKKEILDKIRKYAHPFRISKGKGFRLKHFDLWPVAYFHRNRDQYGRQRRADGFCPVL